MTRPSPVRRRSRRILAAAAASLLAGLPALSVGTPALAADDYPNRPVRLIVGFPPGGTTDVMGRLVATRLSEKLGQQFVVDNRPGASGMIGSDLVAKAPADGYTLLFSSSTIATFQALYAKVPFDPFKDLDPIATVSTTPYVMVVHPSLPVKSVAELVAYAKANPGRINYAASAPGGGQQLGWEMLKRNTGTDMVYVPYKGTGALLPDLIGGVLQAAIDNVAVLTPHIRNGSLRPLAVTGERRSALLPDVPTMIESGQPGFKVVGWFGVFAPSKTPPQIIARLSKVIGEVMNESGVRDRLAELGAEPDIGGPDALRQLLASETRQWGGLIREIGIVPQ